jgi:hypothetical protein
MSGVRVGDAFALKGNERWLLVHTLPRSEERARLHLRERQGFRTHLPRISRTVRAVGVNCAQFVRRSFRAICSSSLTSDATGGCQCEYVRRLKLVHM